MRLINIYTPREDLAFVHGPNNTTYLLGENERHVLTGSIPAIVFPVIDGIRTDDEIVEAVSTRLNPEEAYYGLLHLHSKNYILKKPTAAGIPDSAWWHTAGICTDRVQKIMNAYSIVVITPQEDMKALLTKAFFDAGFHLEETDDRQSIKIIACDNYCNPILTKLLSDELSKGFFCYPVKLCGSSAWFGPLLKPNRHPCWSCFHYYLKRNRPVESYLEKISVPFENYSTSPPSSGISKNVAINMAVVRMVKAMMDESHSSQTLETLDFWSMEAKQHTIRRRPQCPHCGNADLYSRLAVKKIELSSSKMKFRKDGGYRTCTPEETWDNYKHLVSHLTGIINSIGPVKSKNHPLRPVFSAGYFVHPPVDEVTDGETFSKNSFGKGHTQAQAKASALCEAIERYCAMYQGDEPVLRGKYSELKPEAIDPRKLLDISDSQYNAKEKWDKLCPRQPLPLPFDESVTISWTPAWSLTYDKKRLLPLSYCYSYVPMNAWEKMCPHNPNGHAAGNTPEEAILQALLELIERDAVAIWWYNRLKFPALDCASFDDHYFIQVQNHYYDLGWDVWVLDVTHDLEIPVAVAIARNRGTGGFVTGLGCHLEMRLAIQRAITEMHQIFDSSGNQKPVWTADEIERHDFLFPDTSKPLRQGKDFSYLSERSLNDDILYCVAKLKMANMETIVLDYTRPDIGLATVKAVVPGLRHFWPRLGPGRLYDVPVQMGWIPKALAEDDLNPKPLIL